MAIEDYIPNIFGGGMPSYLPGLLGEEETAALQKRANVQGLLGAAITLAGGMAPYGPRRTAAQNVLGALAGGFQAGQGAYQGAMQNFAMQQQMADAKLKREKAMMDLEGMRQFKEKYPDLFPIAAIDAKEAASAAAQTEAFKPIQAIYSGIGQPTGQVMPQQVPQGAPSVQGPAVGPDGMVAPVDVDPQTGEKIFAPTPVVANKTAVRINTLMAQNEALQNANAQLLRVRGGAKMIEDNNKLIEANRKEIGGLTSAEFDFEGLKKQVPEQLKPFVDRIESLAFSGVMQPKEVNDAISEIQKTAFDFGQKQQDYTNESRRLSAELFGKPLNELSQGQLAQLNSEMDAREMAKRRAGASSTNINMPSESERTAGFLTNRLQNSLNQMQTVIGQSPTAATPNAVAEIIKWTTGSDYFKNLATPEDRQRVEAAQIDILDAALTLGTGAAYTREQLEGYRKSYFPQLNDKPATIADKAKRLQSLLDSAMIKSGRAAPAPTGGGMSIQDQIQMELQRRKGK